MEDLLGKSCMFRCQGPFLKDIRSWSIFMFSLPIPATGPSGDRLDQPGGVRRRFRPEILDVGGDPRLNSVHLDPVRRQDFRRARARLLGARGCETICYERALSADSDATDHTIVNQDVAPPAELGCWLTNGHYIYPLKIGVNTLGRSSDNDVVVSDAFVSRRHCAILVHAQQTCELYDIASRNGTLINGVRLAGPTPLRPGDQIRLSDQTFTFMSRNGEPQCD
jgi:hypothetical protein